MNENAKRLLAAVRQRTLCPMPKVRFVKWITTPSGLRIYAEDYGYRAFPIQDRRKSDRPTQVRFSPVRNGLVLPNGLRAGDRVRLQDVGTGTILLVSSESTVVQLDANGFCVERPTRMIWRQLRTTEEYVRTESVQTGLRS